MLMIWLERQFSRTLVQDLSQNHMIQNISPFFEWNVAHMTVNDSSF